MKNKKAYTILANHNKWRRDSSVPSKLKMADPKELGKAIDHVLKILKPVSCTHKNTKQTRLPHVSGWYFCHACETPFKHKEKP
jgi:hypothetical protein